VSSAPAPVRPAAAPATAAPPEEESVSWEQLASETNDFAAKYNTPRSGPRKPASKKISSVHLRHAPSVAERLWDRMQRRPQLWWAIGIGGAVAAGILLTVLWWALVSGDSSPKVDRTPVVRGPLVISKTDPETPFRSIHAALTRAQPGDRIIVKDEVIEEGMLQLGEKARLTLEGGVPGKRVKWRFPADAPKEKQMLLLSEAAGIVVKDFEIEGSDRVEDVILLTGSCPGTRLEGLVVRGFTRSGIKINNSAGSPEQPVKLTDVKVFAKRETDAGLLFDLVRNIRDPAGNQPITVDDCLVSGPTKAAYLVNYPKLNPTVSLPASARPVFPGKK